MLTSTVRILMITVPYPECQPDNRDQDDFGDVCDNCPRIENDDQADMDMDGVGDISRE